MPIEHCHAGALSLSLLIPAPTVIRYLFHIGRFKRNDATQHFGKIFCGKIATIEPKIVVLDIFGPASDIGPSDMLLGF